MSDLAVATFGLTKRYRGNVLAVDRIDLRVARGEIYAFLGLNGAGKSTTIRMLLGMIAPTAGRAELFGQPVMGTAGPAAEPVSAGGVAIVAVTALLGIVATFAWWGRADQTG